MSKQFKISGKASFQNIEMGFWGIVSSNGKKYRPINMPEQLKIDGAEVHCVAREVEYDIDIFMWGSPVEIVSFETPSP
jgi:hypothetical protein